MSSNPDILISRILSDNVDEYLQNGMLTLHPAVQEGLAEDIAAKKADFFVATVDEQPAGQIGMRWAAPKTPAVRSALGLKDELQAPQIGFLFVPENFRQRGVATALVRAAVNEAVVCESPIIWGKFDPELVAMRSLFTRLGYEFPKVIIPMMTFNPSGDEPTQQPMEIVFKRLQTQTHH